MDNSGNVYVTGNTESSDFPTMSGAFDTTYNGGDNDAFVAKLDSAGSALVYSTYLGGSDYDAAQGIALDGSGNAYVTGETRSSDFPTTTDAFQRTFASSEDAFVVKLNSSGSDLIYSTYLGGNMGDSSGDIAVDGSGNAYVTGGTASTDFPTTAGAFDGILNGGDAFVTKVNSSGVGVLYSTYLGGVVGDYGSAIALDSSDDAYIVGNTASSDFPTIVGALDNSYNGGGIVGDVFVARVQCIEAAGEGEGEGEEQTPSPTPTPAPSTNIFNFVCPTASATASTALATKLDRLREWRDGVLLETRFGEAIARTYYAPKGF